MTRPYVSSFSIHYPELTDVDVFGLSPGVNVIYGPNEIGKTRTRDFLEWIMFANSPEYENLKPAAQKTMFAHLHPGLSGACEITTENGTHRISQSNESGVAHATISSAGFSLRDVSQLLTDSMSRDHYKKVFSLSLDELTVAQSNKLMTEDELAEVFLSASQTGTGVSLSLFTSALKAARDEMFSESGNAKKRPINRTLKELQEITKEINQLKRDEKNLDGLDSEIATLNDRAHELAKRIEEISAQIVDKKTSLKNYPLWEEYENILNTPDTKINVELAYKCGEIEVLKADAANSVEEESQRETLRDQIIALQREHDVQHQLLSHTVNPDELNDYAHTPEFKSSIKKYETASEKLSQELSRVHENYQRESKELIFVQQQAQKLAAEIEREEHKTETPTVSDVPAITAPSRKKAPLFAAVLGLIFVVAGIASSQFLASAAGLIVVAASAAYYLLSAKSEITPVAPVHVENVFNTAHNQLSDMHDKITHYEEILGELLEQQTQIESRLAAARDSYNSALMQAGFSASDEPHLVDIYLDAFQEYSSRSTRMSDLMNQQSRLSQRIDILLEKVNSLRGYAIGTPCELSAPLETLRACTTWLESLYELASDAKNSLEIQDRIARRGQELEKMISQTYGNIGSAHTAFESFDSTTVEADMASLSETLHEQEAERTETTKNIGRLEEQRMQAFDSTELSDALVTKSQLEVELNLLHKEYAIRCQAVALAEEAFAYCQRENQPAVLQRASHMFNEATRGIWDRVTIEYVHTAKSSSPSIFVSNGSTQLAATSLSRGAAEQLYLCLRLALMETSQRGKTVPVFFDDIAVNADRSRFEALAPIIGNVGHHRQVFYFTCHEATRDMLQKHAAAHIINL